MIEELIQRKSDHIDICLKNPVEAKNATTLFECVNLIHKAIPELNFDKIHSSAISSSPRSSLLNL